MSDEDDDRGIKDNADRGYKPRNAQANENAPKGNIGIDRAFGPSPGMGVSRSSTQATKATEQPPQNYPQQDEQNSPTNKPYAVKTGVAEIDKESIANGYQLKTEAELKALAQGKKKQDNRPKVSQSAFAKSFRQAHGQAPQVEPKGPELE